MDIKENDYVVVLANSAQPLATSVGDLQKKGYVCVGGLIQDGIKLKQAMVLPAPKEQIKEYVLVTGSHPEALQKEVNAMLAQGWRLHDGPTSYTATQTKIASGDKIIVTQDPGPGLIQAMVK